MTYLATLTFDYTGRHNPSARQRMMKALEALHWEYVPTSSMTLEVDSVVPILQTFEVLARTASHPGDLSMLALQVKLVGTPVATPGATKPINALKAVRKLSPPAI